MPDTILSSPVHDANRSPVPRTLLERARRVIPWIALIQVIVSAGCVPQREHITSYLPEGSLSIVNSASGKSIDGVLALPVYSSSSGATHARNRNESNVIESVETVRSGQSLLIYEENATGTISPVPAWITCKERHLEGYFVIKPGYKVKFFWGHSVHTFTKEKPLIWKLTPLPPPEAKKELLAFKGVLDRGRLELEDVRKLEVEELGIPLNKGETSADYVGEEKKPIDVKLKPEDLRRITEAIDPYS